MVRLQQSTPTAQHSTASRCCAPGGMACLRRPMGSCRRSYCMTCALRPGHGCARAAAGPASGRRLAGVSPLTLSVAACAAEPGLATTTTCEARDDVGSVTAGAPPADRSSVAVALGTEALSAQLSAIGVPHRLVRDAGKAITDPVVKSLVFMAGERESASERPGLGRVRM